MPEGPKQLICPTGQEDSAGGNKIKAPGTTVLAPILTRVFRSALAHKSTYGSERNLTVTAFRIVGWIDP